MNTNKFERATEISKEISKLKELISVVQDTIANPQLEIHSTRVGMGYIAPTSLPSWINEKYMELIENDIKDKLKELKKEFEEL